LLCSEQLDLAKTKEAMPSHRLESTTLTSIIIITKKQSSF
jgi:hypothetical protein